MKPVIIEYKHGKPKIGHEDEVQLCAEAMCLEEMLGVTLPSASFFYGEPRRRTDVALDPDLRTETEALTIQLHRLMAAGKTPPAEYTPKCRACSLINSCFPKTMNGTTNVKSYIQKMLKDVNKIE